MLCVSYQAVPDLTVLNIHPAGNEGREGGDEGV